MNVHFLYRQCGPYLIRLGGNGNKNDSFRMKITLDPPCPMQTNIERLSCIFPTHLISRYSLPLRSPLHCYIRKKQSCRLLVHLCIFIPSGANYMQNEWPHSSYLRMDISIKDICCPASPLPRDIIAPLMTVDNCCRQMVLAAPSFLTSTKDNVYTLDYIPCRAWLSAESLMKVNAVYSV